MKAFSKLEQLDGAKIERDQFCAWLMRITSNCAIDLLRRKKASVYIPLDECDGAHSKFYEAGVGSWGESPETFCSRQEQLSIVADAVEKLPAELRNVCLLRTMMELSTNEVAARLGISTIAVRLRLFRAFGQLRRILAGRNVHCRTARPRRLINAQRKRARPWAEHLDLAGHRST